MGPEYAYSPQPRESDCGTISRNGENESDEAEGEFRHSTAVSQIITDLDYLQPMITQRSSMESVVLDSSSRSESPSGSISLRNSLTGAQPGRPQSSSVGHQGTLDEDGTSYITGESLEGSPPLSPLIPLAPVEAHAPKSSQSTNEPRGIWQPYTLQWPFLVLLAVYMVTLLTAVLYFQQNSAANNGIGKDNGSSSILFGWRFTPSMFAVIYVQLTAMLLDDVKRTEPFARLAKPGGGVAEYTIFQAPGAWWNALTDGFSRKKNGRHPSWVLLAAAGINIIGFLAISPLSAALLEVKDVSVSRTVEFSRLRLNQTGSLLPEMGRETYLRILAHVLQRLETSAWITDNYTVLPVWPSEIQDPPLGPSLSSVSQKWRVESLVLSTELECHQMRLVSSHSGPGQFHLPGYSSSNTPMWYITLQSDDGCISQLEVMPDSDDSFQSGSAFWLNISTLQIPILEKEIPSADLAPLSWINSANHSRECSGRELLLFSENWTNFSTPNNVSGQICSSLHYHALLPVDATTSNGQSEVSFDREEYLDKRTKIPPELLRMQEFENRILLADWESYLTVPEYQGRAAVGDLSLLLAARYDFNVGMLISDDDIVSHAASIRQRILGEALQYTIATGISEREQVFGISIVVERRVVVVNGVATALASCFIISICLFLTLFVFSTSRRRHLNLVQDPTTVTGAISLITSTSSRFDGLRSVFQESSEGLVRTLGSYKYFTTQGTLHESESESEVVMPRESPTCKPQRPDTPPAALRLKTLSLFIMFQVSLLITIVVMYSFARRSLLYQSAFLYQTNVTIYSHGLPSVAPISMAPVLLAMGVSLWWTAMDTTFRRLQPFLSLAENPTTFARGPGLSYQSTYWFVAALKALHNKHWLLSLVTAGTSLSPALTIAMSALFERGECSSARTVGLERNLELRTVPMYWEMESPSNPHTPGSTGMDASSAISRLYTHLSTNWLYTATLQLALDGPEPAWSREGWSFVPVNLTGLQDDEKAQGPADSPFLPTTNVSLSTPAIRARVDCRPYEGIDNTSVWLATYDMGNETVWDVQNNPRGSGKGYELTGPDTVYTDAWKFFNTSFLATPQRPMCCGNSTATGTMNGTTNGTAGGTALGYWSFQSADLEWIATQRNFSTKWIFGRAQPGYNRNNSRTWWSKEEPFFIYDNIPEVTALYCYPIIETASADVSVDSRSGRVLSFTIVSELEEPTDPWREAFIPHGGGYDPVSAIRGSTVLRNITASYGLLFQYALIEASHLRTLSGSEDQRNSGLEDLSDNTFNFRDRTLGLNLDFMTYAMYCLTGKDPRALLDPAALENLTQQAFSTFFQHFVSSNMSTATGGWAYQTINSSLPTDIGPVASGLEVNSAYMTPNSHTNRTAIVTVSSPIEVLQMNTVAVWLSVSILSWLIVTTIIIAVLQRRYLHKLHRNVDCIGDVLVLVVGSDKLLRLVRERGVESLRAENEIKAKLDWFVDENGQRRWGIEVVCEEQ